MATTNASPSMERLIVISNRLPISMSRGDDGQWKFRMSSGGLVSALSGLKKMMSFTWIGWPGRLSSATINDLHLFRY
jgi:trehalose 6-phosphate synthase